LAHQRRRKRQVADDQAIANVPGYLEHLRPGGGDKDLRYSGRG
jgi:hypothetical protein